jgi:hypothetical protein
MTQKTVQKVSDGSLTERPAAPERARADPENPDFSRWAGTDLTHEDMMAIEREARAMRARVMAMMIRRAWRAIERAVWRMRQRDLEKYLAQSSNLADLERRIRDLERNRGSGLGGLSY